MIYYILRQTPNVIKRSYYYSISCRTYILEVLNLRPIERSRDRFMTERNPRVERSSEFLWGGTGTVVGGVVCRTVEIENE